MAPPLDRRAGPAQPKGKRRKRKANRGSFQRGPDPRRHHFTREECRRGYLAALDACLAAGWARHAWFFRRLRGYYRAVKRGETRQQFGPTEEDVTR